MRDDSVPPQQEHRVRLVIEHVFLKFAHQRALLGSGAPARGRMVPKWVALGS
jgi:hypothetical protein